MRNDREKPIFVVGCPRSGTTLLAGMLSAHSRLICGPETEFFTGLPKANQGNRLCNSANWPDVAADYLFSKVHDEKPIPEYYNITRDQIVAYLKQRERSCPAMLESLTETYMRRHGKSRWVEKTPTHLIFVHELRRQYPDAPIVRIVRDPRDVALSLLKVSWGPASFAAAVLMWESFDEISASFFETDRNSLTLKFEDVVTNPENELRKLCDFVGEQFEPGMLDTSQSIAHLNPTKLSFKESAGKPVDPNRVATWQRETTPDQKSQAEAIAGDRIKAYGYPTSHQFSRFVQVINLREFVHFPEPLAKVLDGNTRLWKASSKDQPERRFFVGDPSKSNWLGEFRTSRLLNVSRVAATAAHSRIAGIPLVWLGAPPVNQRQNWGLFCRVLDKVLPRQMDIGAFCE